MKNTKQCPKCGSTDIIADAMAVDRGDQNWEQELKVATFRKPAALIFKGQMSSALSAWVCCGCGFVELYADQPQALKSP